MQSMKPDDKDRSMASTFGVAGILVGAGLFALAAWRLNRIAGILASIFAGVIFIGSVHLGWHYAVDGYVGFALALAVWWASKPLATWMDGLSFTRRFLILRGQSGDRAPSTPSQ